MDRLTDATLLSGLRLLIGLGVIIVAGSVAKAALFGNEGNTILHWIRVIGAVLVAISMVLVASTIFSGYLRLGF